MELESNEDAALRRRAGLLALGVALVALLGRGLIAVNLGLDGDEAYYAFWANWLTPGYLDHPPGVAVFIALGESIFGPSLMGVRLVGLVSTALVAAALYRMTRLLVPHPLAPAVAVIWYSLTLVAATGFVATPDAPSVLFWTLTLWAATEAIARQEPNWWLAAGIFAGLGLVGKYTNAWLGIGLVLFLLATPEGRHQLRHWQSWAGGLLAVIVFSPVLWWNATHDWRSFLFQGVRLVRSNAPFARQMGDFLVGQALLSGPVLMVCSVIGILWYLSGRSRKAGTWLALPVLTSLPLLAYFLFHGLHSKVEANWTQPLLPAMTLVGAAWLTMRVGKGWGRVARRFCLIVQPLFGLALIGLVYVQAIFHPFDIGILDRTRMLRGWEELASSVRQLADKAGAQSIWTLGGYQLAGELFFHGKAAGDPRPVRDLKTPGRYDFIPPAERYPQVFPGILVLPGEPKEGAGSEHFARFELLGTVSRPEGNSDERYSVYTVSEPTAAFPSAN